MSRKDEHDKRQKWKDLMEVQEIKKLDRCEMISHCSFELHFPDD